MRTRTLAMTATLGIGALLLLPASAASAKSISAASLRALTNSINQAKHMTYLVEYQSVNGSETSTVTIAQQPPKSNFATSTGSVINNGKTTYYCSTNSGNAGNSGNSGSSNSGSSGNSGNSGATTTTTHAASEQCLSVKGSNPLLGLESTFSPAVVLGAFAEAKEGLYSRLLGIKVSSSSATYAGQPSTCVSVNVRGKSAKYCVTNKGILAYVGSSSSSFELVKYSSSPSSSLFSLPAGATTQTLPGGSSIP